MSKRKKMAKLDSSEQTKGASEALPEYNNPLVNEVVCGVLFESIKTLFAPHLGLLWERFKSDYPTCQEVPPLVPAIETFDRPSGQTPLSIELSELPSLPRVWFVHSGGN